MPYLQKTIPNMVCNKTRISCFENSQNFSSNRQGDIVTERKTAAGIPAAVRTAATGPIFPWPFKKHGHGADTHPWPLRLSIYAARGTSTDQTNRADGCATRRFIVHPYRSSRAAAVAELRAANQWINRVRRRKRLSFRSPSALTAGAHPRW